MNWEIDFMSSLGGKLGVAKYQKEFANLITRLLDFGADIHGTNADGQSPLMQVLAVPGVHAPLVQLLLTRGVQVNSLDEDAISPLFSALEHGQDETIIKMLLGSGVSLYQDEECILFHAISCGCSSTVLELLKDYMTEEQRRKIQWDSLLLQAIDKEAGKECIAWTLNGGAQVNLADSKGVTPLMKASACGFYDAVVTELVLQGSDVSQRDDEGKTALMYACEGEVWSGSVEILLKAGSSVNARAKNSLTPLMFSMPFQEDMMIQALINYGADIDATDSDGRSALRILMENDDPNPSVARMLLEAGADPLLEDDQQQSALSLATVTEKDGALLNLLEKAVKLQR